MTEVYIVTEEYDYEGATVQAVFSNKEAAVSFVMKNFPANRPPWKHASYDLWKDHRLSARSFVVKEFTVDEQKDKNE